MRRLIMSKNLMLSGLLVVGVLIPPVSARADTQATAHRVHKVKKQQPPPPLPSGTRGPVPQVPLDAMPAVPPQVSYQDGLLTIVAPNSTLSEILKGVRKHTAADIEIPNGASERVATHLGPGPARDVMAELLNGSHFNYILLGSPTDAKLLVRVVLVAKTGPETPTSQPAVAADGNAAEAAAQDDAEAATEDTSDDGTDPANTAEDQPPQTAPDQTGGVKTPQQMLQEMQQRQLQMQQQMQQQQIQQQQLQQQQSGQPGPPYPPNGVPLPQRPQPQQQ